MCGHRAGMSALKCGFPASSRRATRTQKAIPALALAARMRVFAGIYARKCEHSRMRVARATSLPTVLLSLWRCLFFLAYFLVS